MNSNIKLEVEVLTIPVIPITYISALTWESQQGERLKTLRGKRSREEVANRLKDLGVNYSVQALYKLEQGETASIAPVLLVSILRVLGGKLESFYPMQRIDVDAIAKLTPK